MSSEPEKKKQKIEDNPSKPLCPHKEKCYRRNPRHLIEYSHPTLEEIFAYWTSLSEAEQKDVNNLPEESKLWSDKNLMLDQLKILKDIGFSSSPPKSLASSSSTSSSTGKNDNINSNISNNINIKKDSNRNGNNNNGELNMKSKWEASHPYNFFLTKTGKEKDRLSVGFKDLFHNSMGKVKRICHINYMITAGWLMNEMVDAGLEGVDVNILYGVENEELIRATKLFPWVKIHLIKSPFPYGHHHTKMSFVQYEDNSIRIFCYTANLIPFDWDKCTQGIWISPECPVKTENSQSQSSQSFDIGRKFKADLLQYFSTYPPKAIGPWIDYIKACDFSAIKTIFVASAPVLSSSGSSGFQWGIKKLEKSLTSPNIKLAETNKEWSFVIQCSSIGTLGAGEIDWLRPEFAGHFVGSKKSQNCPIKLMYPTIKNVTSSYYGVQGGGCLPYSYSTHVKQKWVEKIAHQWKSDSRDRSRAVPHIKSYCQVSPEGNQIAWFLLTSANLSKAAWGKLNKDKTKLSVMSWEAGILFIPSLLTQSETTFKIGNEDPSEDSDLFPMPFDYPLTPYSPSDKIWCMDILINSENASKSSSSSKAMSIVYILYTIDMAACR